MYVFFFVKTTLLLDNCRFSVFVHVIQCVFFFVVTVVPDLRVKGIVFGKAVEVPTSFSDAVRAPVSGFQYGIRRSKESMSVGTLPFNFSIPVIFCKGRSQTLPATKRRRFLQVFNRQFAIGLIFVVSVR